MYLEVGAGIGGQVSWTVLEANDERFLVATCVPIGLVTVGKNKGVTKKILKHVNYWSFLFMLIYIKTYCFIYRTNSRTGASIKVQWR